MANSYPYYIPVHVNGGLLQKVVGRTKYDSAQGVVAGLRLRFQRTRKISHSESPVKGQFDILEYTSMYQCRIVALFEDEAMVYSAIPELLQNTQEVNQ